MDLKYKPNYDYIVGFAFNQIKSVDSIKSSEIAKIFKWINKHEDEINNWINQNNVNLDTEEGQMAFKLRWS